MLPSIVNFLGYTANYTSTNVSTVYDLFTTSSLNTTNLTSSLAMVDSLTLLAPIGSFFNAFAEATKRLILPEYSRHLDRFLKSLVLPMAFDAAMVQAGSNIFETVSGLNQTLTSATFQGSSVRGIDG